MRRRPPSSVCRERSSVVTTLNSSTGALCRLSTSGTTDLVFERCAEALDRPLPPPPRPFRRDEEPDDPDRRPAEEGAPSYNAADRHVFHSWSAQEAIKPMVIAGAEGSYVLDYDGKRYLDFSCQLVNTNIGHQHPKVVAGIKAQADRLCTVAPFTPIDVRSEAARLICELAPDGMNMVFFTNAAAEAIEHASRMARLHTGRIKLLSTYRSYHGGTIDRIEPDRRPEALGERLRERGGRSLLRSVSLPVPVPLFERGGGVRQSARASRTGRGVRRPFDDRGHRPRDHSRHRRHHDSPPGLSGRREGICDRYGIVSSPTRSWPVSVAPGSGSRFQNYDVVPDLVTLREGRQLRLCPARRRHHLRPIAATFAERVYPGGLTYSGHPLACAAAVATINAMKDEGIVENAARIGEQVLGPGLRDLAGRHPSVGEVRGLGVFWALDLVKDKATREPIAPYGGTSPAMDDLVRACKQAGLLPFTNYNRLHAVPPCTVSDDEARAGIAILDEALSAADAYCGG